MRTTAQSGGNCTIFLCAPKYMYCLKYTPLFTLILLSTLLYNVPVVVFLPNIFLSIWYMYDILADPLIIQVEIGGFGAFHYLAIFCSIYYIVTKILNCMPLFSCSAITFWS